MELVARSVPNVARRVRVVGALFILFGAVTGGFLALRAPWPAAMVMGIAGLFGVVLLFASSPGGIEVRVSEEGIRFANLHPKAAPPRTWSWNEVASVELFDIVFEPTPGQHDELEDRVVEVTFRDGFQLALSLHWDGAARVGASLLQERFVPNAAAIGPDVPATRTRLRGPDD